MSADFGDNTIHPLEIHEARQAQYRASEIQRAKADELAAAWERYAEAEETYRNALSERMKELHTEGFDGSKGLAITTCEVIAKGEAPIALLRRKRDERKGAVEAARQEAYRTGNDRRALDGVVQWSMHRDIRVDAEPGPGQWERPLGGERA